MEILKQSPKALSEAVLNLKIGEIVVCPTDTVYGFLADATNKKAVEKIYKVKNRLRSKPLPIFVKDLNMAKELAKISKEQIKIIERYWPGKYTFVLKSKIKNQKSKIFGVTESTIAIRIPKYKFLNDLLKKIKKPLVQTSVNISGQETLKDSKDIIKVFRNSKILIVDAGSLKKSKPSRIIDLTSKSLTILR